MAAPTSTTGLTYDDLASFPDDNLRRELIDGELVVTSSPGPPHQGVTGNLHVALWTYARAHGGRAYTAPLDVHFASSTVLEPDVLYIRPERVHLIGRTYIAGPPDLVVEVSSPSTRRLELVRKRDVYERFGVAEYWYVDRDADRVEVHRLDGDRYGAPLLLGLDEELTSPVLPGFALAVAEVFEDA